MIGCGKDTETLPLTPINELYPMQGGKTFTYRLDSSVLINFGASFVTRSYLIKDSIESTFLDNAGRKSFRIYRYITDTLQAKPFQYSTTYYTTVDTNKIEVVNNNLRFISLVNPVSENTSWGGNNFIAQPSISTNVSYANWNYQYQNIDQPFTVKKGIFQNTTTVLQVADSSIYGKKYSVEVYAKGVGLIYKEMMLNFFQTGISKYEDGNFGIKMSLVDYK